MRSQERRMMHRHVAAHGTNSKHSQQHAIGVKRASPWPLPADGVAPALRSILMI